ncbi:MAG: hypothetical protein AUJ72_00050 [Candidatus Omnitrophica bacterium CG1_02_46_14]|nr:MAG: hypothetical protein AUJ72_00050 [Candidatus Omnitrophica bacterium CG1_02_46_14]
MQRPSKHEYYLGIAKAVAQRATCFRVTLGAVIVKDDQIIATGYVGAPRKTKSCFEHGNCIRDLLKIPHGERYETCRSVHAEQNAIINAARAGVSLLDGVMYFYGERKTGELVDALPCFFCKRMIVNAGIKQFIGYDKKGALIVTEVEDWIKDWQEHDIAQDNVRWADDLKEKKLEEEILEREKHRNKK